ncbi:helix-turn-helix transcriptional regulator [Inquilinus limosus]|uniref:winged helix-turn-helix domain-containing protein n=1 Tax=Inquilinus limosus TaxID=171674 RepID=UPI003F13AB43
MVDASASRERAFSFGPFRLLPSRQLLLEGERPVRLGHRSLEILAALVERAGELVTKRELMARVWPDVIVEETNLRVHITALRKALGEGRPGHRYVANVPGRGYRFVAPVELCEPVAAVRPPAAPRLHNLPRSSMRTIGRADTLEALLRQLPQHRIVSIVGPGGIGKTTVALATADALISAYEHGIWFVDLAPLRDPQLVPSALAFAIGLIREAEFFMRLPAYLGTLAQGLALDGRPAEARSVIEEALGMAERNEELWCLPELLRVKGELLQSEEDCRQALDLARRQGALSWELRAATSLAQLRHRSGEISGAHELLSSVYDRFTEGYETNDLRTARAWIDKLRSRPG